MFRTPDTRTLPAQPHQLGPGQPSGVDAGSRLEHYLRGSDAVVLHQRRLPGKLRKINHIVVGPAGITVVEGRHYRCRKARFKGGQLCVGKRDRTDLVDRVLNQAAAVRELLGGTPYAGVNVEAALALGNVWGEPVVRTWDGRSLIVWGTGLIAEAASRPGPLSADEVNGLASYLAGELSG
jgi:Nuclease-related domain